MRVYYLFKINDSFSNLYYNRTYYLYKMLDEISKSSKNDFIISYRLFSQMATPFNKTDINSKIYRKYAFDDSYKKTLNKHVLNNLTENKVKVNLLGGPVFIEWQGSADDKEQDIFLIGSANYSFFADYIL